MAKKTLRKNGNGHIPLGQGLYLHSQAAMMTQTTGRKLTYWSQTDLVIPHIHRRNGGPSIYSYVDLLAIRAMERLRKSGLPLQRIRKALKFLYETLGSNTDWWNLKMVVDEKDLLVVIPKNQSPSGRDETIIATRAGQKPFELVFAQLVSDLLAGGKLERFPSIKKHISIEAGVQGGAPVIKNTRIKTRVIHLWHQCGLKAKQIAEIYDGLETSAIKAAIKYEKALARLDGHANPPL
jgi:uncharacterized protein (DUF433 family)/DNA-binding transcriptional MerR regulator